MEIVTNGDPDMTILSEVERYKLSRLIQELRSKKGRGTELISLYIPGGKRLDEVIGMLRQEYSQASNIKDRTTRHHVLDALTTVIQRLKMLGRVAPPNGLVIFCGYIDVGIPGKEKLEVHVIEPPEQIKVWLYRCDSRFHTEILEDILREKDVYGLLVMDLSEATFALLKGRRIEVLKTVTSGVPRKHHKGGQSARRFQRLREQAIHEYFKRVAEYASEFFLKVPDLKGVLVGGPGPAKIQFVEGDYLDYRIKEKVVGLVDVEYTGEEGLRELVNRGSRYIKDSRYVYERNLLQRFFERIVRDSDLVVYGEREVMEMMKYGAVDTLIVSEGIKDRILEVECLSCKKTYKIRVREEMRNLICPKCKGPVRVLSEKTFIEELIELSSKFGVKIELVSPNTEEGEMFLKAFGGIGALLRFNPHASKA